MERQMASIQRCVEVRPIPGADKIEVATVLGWECVVKKGSFQPGDLGIYIEVDSIVPEKPQFEFMRDRKWRVKTIRLRGQVSQGLFMPLDDFVAYGLGRVDEGQDVSRLLGITKYDPEEVTGPMFMNPKSKPWWFNILIRIPFLRKFLIKPVGGGIAFPSHLVPKTDEPRLQTFGPGFLEEFKDLPVSITQKMDGTSVTIIWHENKLSVASRNVWFPTKKNNVYWNMVEKIGLGKVLSRYLKGCAFAIQGEICGPSIQGNKYKLEETHLFVYGVYSITKQEYYNPGQLRQFVQLMRALSQGAHLTHVPEIGELTIREIGTTVEEWIKFATSKSTLNPESYNEGIVVRSLDNKPYGQFKMNGKRWSFKVISPEFLLQYGL